MQATLYDVIIVGGSYAGLSSAMTLGRSLRKVLVIDSGSPCNRQTPQAHNFLTQDGETPAEISRKAKEQVKAYQTVSFLNALVTHAEKMNDNFSVKTSDGDLLHARKLIFATGLKDIMPDIPGFAECWGISVIHCPYCHGYEVRNMPTGILANGDDGFEFSKMILHWTKDLTLFTNEPSTLSTAQMKQLSFNRVKLHESKIESFKHDGGRLQAINLQNGTSISLSALYARIPVEQHCHIAAKLGCEMTEQNLIKVDMFQKTSIPGIFACGDNTTFMRTLSTAISMGTTAGVALNKELIEEHFHQQQI
ncbi:MAG: NAD(P)/FAD-dependent oxidoreductase [Pedobacter sp.]|nr:MAG: NAD(P)/FAD-dependent oxidoreductase [Pedobacter sp.]